MSSARPGLKRASVAWLGLAAYVAAYDYYAIKTGRETLSGAYWHALRNPKTRVLAVCSATILYKHLVFPTVLPELDPLYFIAERWRKSG